MLHVFSEVQEGHYQVAVTDKAEEKDKHGVQLRPVGGSGSENSSLDEHKVEEDQVMERVWSYYSGCALPVLYSHAANYY